MCVWDLAGPMPVGGARPATIKNTTHGRTVRKVCALLLAWYNFIFHTVFVAQIHHMSIPHGLPLFKTSLPFGRLFLPFRVGGIGGKQSVPAATRLDVYKADLSHIGFSTNS